MYLSRLIYTSKISEEFEQSDIKSILDKSKKNNKKNHITGMLCFNRKYFLQCIEGSRQAVNETYQRILNDTRHTNILMLEYQEIYVREFDCWTMGYIPETRLTNPINLKYSDNDLFTPHDMSGPSAYQLMLALKDYVPLIE
ncbi:BLUF domain-containing protein [Pseudoalteromonas tunicata]|jgi:hypothetical protein|uniref:BLUF n=1 Tax=Pseudoalteromonas tunicata D2 TaxID=87626 RepID=A4C8E2_9GAMM|nr:BLUF domain-containing protein [Pseudoalteromonas tunicata]ATC93362.1 hypothetical protein PTUN_a0589 [Pseudoalteromonas tunicata]AXT32410.1 BLUF domain-containing protein [Pseudoalteromonas tunicata]EAR28857.1 BLUF [Pseudoalteromonas tunicata D2]